MSNSTVGPTIEDQRETFLILDPKHELSFTQSNEFITAMSPEASRNKGLVANTVLPTRNSIDVS